MVENHTRHILHEINVINRTIKQNLMGNSPESSRWTFLTNHSHVLICLRREPFCRIRDIADQVGITERMVQRILSDFELAGVIQKMKEGRRNRYVIDESQHLRHPLECSRTVSDLLGLVDGEEPQPPDESVR